MQTLIQDLRYASRILLANRGFAIVAISTLALGIGATTAIFSFVNAVVLRPFPFKDSGRLVMVLPQSRQPTPFPVRSITPGDFLEWQAQNHVFEAMAGFAGGTFSITTGGEPERVLGATVTRGFFDALGVAPLVGRPFRTDDAADTVVVGAAIWRERFGSDPGLPGKAITLDGKRFTVVGVMPDDFTFPRDALPGTAGRARQAVGLWTPLDLRPGDRSNAMMQVFARLKPGVTMAQATSEINTIAAAILVRLGRRQTADLRLVSLRDDVSRDVRRLLFVLLGAVGFLLLIACTNVANLLIGRGVARQREIGIRSALGSGTWRLVRQFLTESVVLSLAGGAAGVLVAAWGIDLAVQLIPPGAVPRLAEVRLDAPALAFALAISIVTGVLFGLAPALQSRRADVIGVLKASGTTQTSRTRFFNTMIVAEVALSFVLLAGAGLLFESFMHLTRVDPGFRPDSTLTVTVTLPDGGYPSSPEMRRFTDAALERLRAIPGVDRAGAINWLPLGGNFISGDVTVEDIPGASRLMVGKPAVSAEYFQALAIPVLRGRAFTARDTEQAPGVTIVSDSFARRVWPGQDAIGRRIKPWMKDGPWLTVVGVVGDVRQMGLDDTPGPTAYVPLAQAPRPFLLRNLTFVVRTTADPMRAADAIRQEIRAIDPTLPFDRIRTMRQLVADSVSEPRFRSVVFGGFAAAALTLVGIGILGVLAHAVSRRTREIGVRVALGARRVDVVRLVVRQAVAMAGAGVALGAAAAIALTRLLTSFLFDVQPLDPATFGFAAATLVGVALFAAYVPARRAAIVDPVIALRAE